MEFGWQTSSQIWPYLALAVVVAGNVLGNLFMKLGAGLPADKLLFFGVFGWPTFLGIAVYGSCVLLYAWALKFIDLHAAQAIVALQFAGVVLVAAFFFREAISIQKWFGIGLILAGIVLCTRQELAG